MSRIPPTTGDVFDTDLPPPKGSEAGFPRPVVVFQAPELKGLSTVLCIPLTTNLKRTGTVGSLFIAAGDGGLSRDSVALCHLLRALDKKHLRLRLGALKPETVNALADALLATFGIAVEPSWDPASGLPARHRFPRGESARPAGPRRTGGPAGRGARRVP